MYVGTLGNVHCVEKSLLYQPAFNMHWWKQPDAKLLFWSWFPGWRKQEVLPGPQGIAIINKVDTMCLLNLLKVCRIKEILTGHKQSILHLLLVFLAGGLYVLFKYQEKSNFDLKISIQSHLSSMLDPRTNGLSLSVISFSTNISLSLLLSASIWKILQNRNQVCYATYVIFYYLSL